MKDSKQESPVVDRRIVRTKRAIRQAFLHLLTEIPFEDITVSALSDQAGINRKTFYLHYPSTRELYDEIRREEFLRISRLPCWKKLGTNDVDPYEVFLSMNRLIEEDSALYRAIFSPVSATTTLQKIKEAILDSEEFQVLRRTRVDLDYYMDYTISGLFALYLRWLGDPNRISIEELARIATELTHHGLRPFTEAAKQLPSLLPPTSPRKDIWS